MKQRCSICLSEENHTISVTENMFGLPGQFIYCECLSCGHVWLTNPPSNLGEYYPKDYYSFNKPSALKSFLIRKRSAHTFGRRNQIGKWIEKLIGPDPVFEWFRIANVGKNDRIIDVGCGSGVLIRDLQETGYTSIQGLDPYIAEDQSYGSIRIRKMSVFDLDEKFDFMGIPGFKWVDDLGASPQTPGI